MKNKLLKVVVYLSITDGDYDFSWPLNITLKIDLISGCSLKEFLRNYRLNE